MHAGSTQLAKRTHSGDSHLCQSAEVISCVGKVTFIALRIHPLCSTCVTASTHSMSHKLSNKWIHYTTWTQYRSCDTDLSFWPCYWAYTTAHPDRGHIHWTAIFVKTEVAMITFMYVCICLHRAQYTYMHCTCTDIKLRHECKPHVHIAHKLKGHFLTYQSFAQTQWQMVYSVKYQSTLVEQVAGTFEMQLRNSVEPGSTLLPW